MSDRSSPRRNLSRAPVLGLLAGILLFATSFEAAAQFGPGAVVCVGSELETLESSSPVRRVVTTDVAVIYRVGVTSDDREGMESALLSELGDHAEVSCAWSSPGDSHVVIIQYTGGAAARHDAGSGRPEVPGLRGGLRDQRGGGRNERDDGQRPFPRRTTTGAATTCWSRRAGASARASAPAAPRPGPDGRRGRLARGAGPGCRVPLWVRCSATAPGALRWWWYRRGRSRWGRRRRRRTGGTWRVLSTR